MIKLSSFTGVVVSGLRTFRVSFADGVLQLNLANSTMDAAEAEALIARLTGEASTLPQEAGKPADVQKDDKPKRGGRKASEAPANGTPAAPSETKPADSPKAEESKKEDKPKEEPPKVETKPAEPPKTEEPKAKEETRENGVDLSDKALVEARRLLDVITYFQDRGYREEPALIAVCEKYRDEIPVLTRIDDMPGRINRALATLGR